MSETTAIVILIVAFLAYLAVVTVFENRDK